jgi:mRNA-degrading endonuclease RelE of RelBE toxin-antitoxin system
MNYNIETIPYFDKQAKKLAKKHKSLKQDLKALFESLEINPNQGIKLTENTYKIRLAIKSKAKGKSGGARVITHIKIIEETVYLLSIFDKSSTDSISNDAIIELLKEIE